VSRQVNDDALNIVFRDARSHGTWQDKPVTDAQLHAIYELMKMAPTTANSQPTRILFLRSEAAKERLRPALSAVNTKKVMTAPVTAILGHDTRFFEMLPRLYRNPAARSWYDNPQAPVHSLRNSSIQGGFFIAAARAIGLDCGPMSGFDQAKVDAEFFPDGRIKSNFLCSLGYGDPAALPPRDERLSFDEVCKIL
jgi:3-hydroxypropanoate dehydrogenase